MTQDFQPGDYLVFQLESGYGLLRMLAVDETAPDATWHVTVYGDLFPDVETADAALENGTNLTAALAHVALTNRAFESTQVAKIANAALNDDEIAPLTAWRNDPGRATSDRSVRLMLGLR